MELDRRLDMETRRYVDENRVRWLRSCSSDPKEFLATCPTPQDLFFVVSRVDPDDLSGLMIDMVGCMWAMIPGFEEESGIEIMSAADRAKAIEDAEADNYMNAALRLIWSLLGAWKYPDDDRKEYHAHMVKAVMRGLVQMLSVEAVEAFLKRWCKY